MVPFFFLLEVHRPRLLKWSDILFIDAKPAMSDNGAEVVHLSAPQQWHTTLDLRAGPVTFRNGGSPLATTTVVVAEGPREDNVPAPLSSLRGRRSYGRSEHAQALDRRGPALLLLHRGAVRCEKQGPR